MRAATCENVRDHLVRLQLPKRGANRESVMRRALGPEYIAHCTRALSEPQRKCILDARQIGTALECTSRVTGNR